MIAAPLKNFVPGRDSLLMAGWEKIQEQVASAVATVDFVLPAGYRNFKLIWTGIVPAVDGALLTLRTSTDGGANYDAGANDYGYAALANITSDPTTPVAFGDTTIDYIFLSTMDTAVAAVADGEATLYNPGGATFKRVTVQTVYYNISTVLVSAVVVAKDCPLLP